MIREFLRKLRNGEFGLFETYWGFGVLVIAIANFTLELIPWGIINALLALLCLLYWSQVAIGILRAARKYKGSKIWSALSELTVVLWILIAVSRTWMGFETDLDRIVTPSRAEPSQGELSAGVVAPTQPVTQGLGESTGDIQKALSASNVASEKSGKRFVSNQVIIGFKVGTPLAEIQEVIRSISARELQHFSDRPLFLLEVPDTGEGREATRIVATLRDDQRIDYIGLNYLTEPSSAESAR